MNERKTFATETEIWLKKQTTQLKLVCVVVFMPKMHFSVVYEKRGYIPIIHAQQLESHQIGICVEVPCQSVIRGNAGVFDFYTLIISFLKIYIYILLFNRRQINVVIKG